ncbi:MAG TPA: LemA family protein [Patescibacteria group bacterium]|nr:LemA family protein [Patescibacteria group bacterium]
MEIFLWVLAGVIVIVLFWLIAIYNGLIKLKTRTDEAWSDIDVQLKRRYDLIPNLIETVKGYASHEQETFAKVIQARNMAMQQTGTVEAKAKAENMLSSTLKSIFALAESYPDLKANQNFLRLQDELSDTENKIQASRRFYNGNARDFNIKVKIFPNNLIVGLLGFKKFDFFEAEAGEKENIKVKF